MSMYRMVERQDTVRISPERLGEGFDTTVMELTHVNFEGKMNWENYLTVLTTDIEIIGEGRIVHGDGGVYQNVKYKALVFRPEMHEVIHGTVCQILKFGAFVRFGPLDGLLHISQIMDDHIEVDLKNDRLVGKDSNRELRMYDKVRARIVAISINERNPRESKIGLTMRQPGLGKLEWLEDEYQRRLLGEDAEKPQKKSKKGKGSKKEAE
jgi:DNA-directed RNA polymerase subunit E'